MLSVKVETTRLELQAPYHPALPLRARAIGGRWMGAGIGWTFPLSAEAALRALCEDIWAVDGSPEASAATVDLQIAVDERAPVRRVFLAYEGPIYLVGREIAASLINRKAARPGRGIRFLEGKPRCVETPSKWSTVIPNGSVFLVRDVPTMAIARFRHALAGAGELDVRATKRPEEN
ncbi:hypothetical protein ACELLULO517_13480 [Acidisoma cellulosilytica]|uniref:Uncharacterized protein n=1 Tax=Acidisoma cellulosilyticum TaxID=2802395 RepID=A0A964E4T0_9PROT|nr:hypothetical protein [Acidisoma cellulosilyticum]MCB8881253.1 hypothetical protein [Acidisoma cellulosilyticum]